MAEGLEKTDLVVSVDLFMNETARRHADVVLPGTAWLEELGFKMTNTHLYLMERALEAEGEAKSVNEILGRLADALDLLDFFPWASQEDLMDAILDHPSTRHATVASLRAAGGFVPLDAPGVAYRNRKFTSPSGKIEFLRRAGGGGRFAAASRPRAGCRLCLSADPGVWPDAHPFSCLL